MMVFCVLLTKTCLSMWMRSLYNQLHSEKDIIGSKFMFWVVMHQCLVWGFCLHMYSLPYNGRPCVYAKGNPYSKGILAYKEN